MRGFTTKFIMSGISLSLVAVMVYYVASKLRRKRPPIDWWTDEDIREYLSWNGGER